MGTCWLGTGSELGTLVHGAVCVNPQVAGWRGSLVAPPPPPRSRCSWSQELVLTLWAPQCTPPGQQHYLSHNACRAVGAWGCFLLVCSFPVALPSLMKEGLVLHPRRCQRCPPRLDDSFRFRPKRFSIVMTGNLASRPRAVLPGYESQPCHALAV